MASPTDYNSLSFQCRICGEFLETKAEQDVGIHIGCNFYNEKAKFPDVKGAGYGFSRKRNPK